ncbi:MAG: hypothetical protein SOZ53_02280 [Candidatus Onthovivens sp.]|nr:hypothetical protein [Candidatus Onthovivens sp.]
MDEREKELINDYKTVGEIIKGESYSYYELIDYCDELLHKIEELKEEYNDYVEYVKDKSNDSIWY